ncbi:armadillo-type protein, partial [Coemansia spiralis]
MGDSISKRHEKLRQQQHANIDSWCGRAPVLDSKSLDSSMKKNTGFIKKCKTSMGQDNSTQLVREVKMLKLEKYVSEIVPAVAEGLQKCRTAGDFAAAIDIISALHSRFPLQFTVPLIKLVLKGLMPPILSALAAMSPEQREKEEQARLSRQKTLLRVVAEMYLNGLLWGIDSLPGGIDGLDAAAAFMLSYASPSANSSSAGSSKQPGHCVLVGALQNLFLSDKEHHLSIVLATTFAKTFRADFAICKEDELSNSAAAIIPLLVDSHQSDPVVGQENCRRTGTILHDYLDSAVSHLENMHKTLTKMRRNNEERLFNKGIIHVDVKEKLEYHTKSFSRLSDNVQMLCEALDQEIPHFDDGADDENQLGIVFDDPAAADAARDAQAQSQWADEEERGFYEAVLDLQSELPPSMLAAAHKKSKSQKEADAKRLLPLSTMTAVVKQQAGSSRVVTRTIAPMSFSNVLRSLTTFTSKEDADKAAVAFCYVNNQSNREALVRALVEVPRQQLYIIPYYARFIAILHRYFPEIGENVVDELKREFNWLVKQRFKNLTDVRLKNIKYIAELTKFKVAPLHVAYRCAKSMLEQFHVFNIEVLCALLEGCGRFLMAQPLTSARVSSLLEIIMRKRRALNLDERSSLLIENAYYACLPLQARKMVMTKYRTPYELYIRKLIYEDLTRSTVEFVCQKLRKLPWGTIQADDPQRVGHALVNCFTKIWKVKYSNVYIVTMILGALGRVHPWFRVAVVDAVLERVKLGLEHNLFTRNQRRITEARYIGEMFIYKIVDSKEVFELLYFMLRYGHSEPHPVPGRTCDADMSNDYFRIRLVCTLLSTCGQYISSRSAEDHRELEKYATYLQMYILAKEQPLPVDISYNVDTLFENALASVKQFGTWGEAAQAMATIVQAGEMQNNVDASEYLDSRADSRDDDDKSGAGSKDEGEESFSDDVDAEEAAEMERIRAEDEEMEEARQQMEALEALLDQEEEDLLEREFNKLVLDSTELRKTERSNKLDVGIPMNLIGSKADGEGDSAENYNAIRFSLLTGKKQKPVVRDVNIPLESQIARNLRQQEEMAMREKAHLKRIVLSYERREAEEE